MKCERTGLRQSDIHRAKFFFGFIAENISDHVILELPIDWFYLEITHHHTQHGHEVGHQEEHDVVPFNVNNI